MSSADARTLLSAVAGSRRPPPDPTLTVCSSADFQSDATGGSSGRGSLALRSSMISRLLVDMLDDDDDDANLTGPFYEMDST